MRTAIFAILAAGLMATASAAQAETWWRLGKTTENSGLYIDADSIYIDDDGYGEYRGMFVYGELWTRDTGEKIRYEVLSMEVDCMFGGLYEERRKFYGDDRALVFEQATGEAITTEPNKASGWEEDFACGSESEWRGKGYYPVSDPVSDSRGW